MNDCHVHVLRSVSGRESVGNDGTIPVAGRERVGNDGTVLNSGLRGLGRESDISAGVRVRLSDNANGFGVTPFYDVIDEDMQQDARNKESNKKAHRMTVKPLNRNSNHSLAAGHRWL